MTYDDSNKETTRTSGSILQPLVIAALVVALGVMAFVQVNKIGRASCRERV